MALAMVVLVQVATFALEHIACLCENSGPAEGTADAIVASRSSCCLRGGDGHSHVLVDERYVGCVSDGPVVRATSQPLFFAALADLPTHH